MLFMGMIKRSMVLISIKCEFRPALNISLLLKCVVRFLFSKNLGFFLKKTFIFYLFRLCAWV